MTQPFVDPQLSAFWADDPTRLVQPTAASTESTGLDPRQMEEVALGLSAAFIVMHRFVSSELRSSPAPMPGEAKKLIKAVWDRHAPTWMKLTKGVILKGYQIGLVEGLSQDELEYMAQSYAEDLGEYVNETSAQALVEGFQDQLAQKWSEQLAWYRAASAFGLDSQQMRTYVRGPVGASTEDSNFELLPPRAQAFLDKAVMIRAERLGGHEAWQSMEMGKALSWMALKNAGTLSADAQKEWLTAVDEKVCPQCGPLHRKRVHVDEQFQTPDGRKFWSPGVHPNCRCDVKLIYPEIANDPWSMVQKDRGDDHFDRDRRGRFAPVESRPAKAQVTERERDPAVDAIMQQVAELDEDLEQAAEPVSESPFKQRASASPFAAKPQQTTSPFLQQQTAASTSPFAVGAQQAQTTTSPFAVQTESPFARAKAKVLPMIQRQIIVMMPNGTVQTVNADEATRGVRQLPLYVWQHQVLQDQATEGDEVDPVEADLTEVRKGDIVDFDDARGNVATVGRPWMSTWGNMWSEARDMYEDEGDWQEPGVQSQLREWRERFKGFEQSIPIHSERIVNQMTRKELQSVLENGGVRLNDTDADELRTTLLFNLSNDNVGASFTYFLEKHHPSWVGGPNGIGADLDRVNEELHTSGLIAHTPTVFVLPTQHPGTAYIDHRAVLHGQYIVDKIITRHGELDLGETRPDNIHSIRVAYLKPVFDNPADEAQNIDYTRMKNNMEFDRQGFAHQRIFDADEDEDERMYQRLLEEEDGDSDY